MHRASKEQQTGAAIAISPRPPEARGASEVQEEPEDEREENAYQPGITSTEEERVSGSHGQRKPLIPKGNRVAD